MNIGMIGASGLMGRGIAANLLANGYALSIVAHRKRETIDALKSQGATEVPSIQDLCFCDLVFLCVTGTPEVRACVLGEAGLLTLGRSGLYVVDLSTCEPESTLELRHLCEAKGIKFIDAPLARGPRDAEQGTLNVMVGASTEELEVITPVLKTFTENIFHVGKAGSGHVVKLLHNFMGQVICNAAAEAFAVSAKAGVDPQKMVDVIGAGAVNSMLFQVFSKSLIGNFNSIQFQLDNARKDIRYYTHLAESLKVPALMGEATHQNLVMASALGFGNDFVASLVRAQEKINDVKISSLK
jgi:3-hydroxyisobutyrate dehydrogenase-like beta-hydroxyacid dehydrogenase